MQGLNIIRPRDNSNGQRLQVHEIWKTIQGEGPYYGVPAIFVRLTGCNLSCTFCDTTWDDQKDPYMDVEQISLEVLTLASDRVKLVVLTGGEPARQELSPLIHRLGKEGFQVQIETAGTYWQECFKEEHVTVVCSPKGRFVHKTFHEWCFHWKYVIQHDAVSLEDGLPNEPTQRQKPEHHGAPARPLHIGRAPLTIWLSPCDEGINVMKSNENIKAVGQIALKYGYRAQVQMHKILQLP
jgi:organic radical activating enzyme